MLHEYPLSDHEFCAFSGNLEYAREWANKNQVVEFGLIGTTALGGAFATESLALSHLA